MNILIYIPVFFIGISASFVEEAEVQFHTFKIKYEKSYENSLEEARRFEIFRDNLKSIEEHNSLYQQGKTTWKKGITKYTDFTDEEYKSMLALQIPSSIRKLPNAQKLEVFPGLSVPNAIDWREKGQVTEVYDQGTCAASWAFSVAGSIEAAYFRKSGNLVPLSEQQLVDCTFEVGNNGCIGGGIRRTFSYIEYSGMQSNEGYPYNGTLGTCQYGSSDVITKIDSFKYFFASQYQLERVVGNIGPVSASLDASEIKDYTSGIYGTDTCDSLSVNLAVVIVGYGSEDGTNYWIVKNCYGKDWGEDGYIRVLRKPNYFSCGLYFENILPIIN